MSQNTRDFLSHLIGGHRGHAHGYVEAVSPGERVDRCAGAVGARCHSGRSHTSTRAVRYPIPGHSGWRVAPRQQPATMPSLPDSTPASRPPIPNGDGTARSASITRSTRSGTRAATSATGRTGRARRAAARWGTSVSPLLLSRQLSLQPFAAPIRRPATRPIGKPTSWLVVTSGLAPTARQLKVGLRVADIRPERRDQGRDQEISGAARSAGVQCGDHRRFGFRSQGAVGQSLSAHLSDR
jgi:hypothetical protein